MAAAIAVAMVVGVDSSAKLSADYADGYRTEARGLPEAVKVWRQDAWRLDDFFAQVRLGDLYSQSESFDRRVKESPKNPSFQDPVEAYVWYFMALRPDHFYSFSDNYAAYQSLYSTRYKAQTNAERVYYSLTFEQRLEARGRILYILASRGAEGFMTLGRLHGVGISPPGGGGGIYNPNTPQILLCMRSDYTYWPLSWYWYLRTAITGEEYPHLPVWKWVENSPKNWDLRYPESECDYAPPPPAPMDNLPTSSVSSYPSSGPVPLNNSGAGGPTNLPVSPPNVSIGPDPRSSLPGGSMSSAGGGNSGAIALTPDQSGGMAYNTGSGGYPGSSFSGSSYPGGYPSSSSGGYPGSSSGGYPGSSYPGSSFSGGGYPGGGYPGGGYPGGGYPGGGYPGGGYGSANVPSVFVSNEAEALTYFTRAEKLGHPMADSYIAALRYSIGTYGNDGERIIADAEKRALFWAPPYEFYPGITTPGGMPHSDESYPSVEERIALGRVYRDLPWRAIAEALDFRRYTKGGRGCGQAPICYVEPIRQFQKALGFEQTGKLTAPQVVRLIKMAAVDGHAPSQDRLGIMYAKGVGVPQNYVRAEKWFIAAANQNNADALFNLSVLYDVGPNGIDKDENKAASYRLRAMAAGYNLLFCELQELLSLADDRHDRRARR